MQDEASTSRGGKGYMSWPVGPQLQRAVVKGMGAAKAMLCSSAAQEVPH